MKPERYLNQYTKFLEGLSFRILARERKAKRLRMSKSRIKKL